MTSSAPEPKPALNPLRTNRLLVIALLLTTIVGASAAVAQVWTHLKVIDLGYKISRASAAHTKLLEANRRLKIEVAVLKSPTRIATLAHERLAMRPPEPEQIRRVRLAQEPAVVSPPRSIGDVLAPKKTPSGAGASSLPDEPTEEELGQ